MTILVTGAAGFIASHLIEKLLEKGYEVIGIDNFSNGTRSNLQKSEKNSRFTFIPLDLKDTNKVRDLFNDHSIDMVYHLAARGSVPASISDPVATFENNVVATHNLMILAIQKEVARFIYASSSSVYGDLQAIDLNKKGEFKSIAKSEDMPLAPLNPYGISKQISEIYSKNFAELYNFSCAGLRFFNVYGPRQKADSKYAAVIPTFINNALTGKNLIINGDGFATRDFTYVSDVVKAMLCFTTLPPADWAGQVYNVCNSKETTINELAKTITSLITTDSKIVSHSCRDGDIKHSLGSNAKLMHDLYFKPTTLLKDGLLETITYYKSLWGHK